MKPGLVTLPSTQAFPSTWPSALELCRGFPRLFVATVLMKCDIGVTPIDVSHTHRWDIAGTTRN